MEARRTELVAGGVAVVGKSAGGQTRSTVEDGAESIVRTLPFYAGAMHYWRVDPAKWTACLRAMHALGFAGMWVSGANTYDPFVQKALGIGENEILLGFIGVGTAPAAYDGRQPPVREPAVSDWAG